VLRALSIRDYVIVERLDLELASGFTALTGETGAGKSILVDALGLALGGRADAGIVRQGAQRAEVSADFDIESLPAVRDWLAAQDFDEGDGRAGRGADIRRELWEERDEHVACRRRNRGFG